MELRKAKIVEELDRVCASSEFRNKPVMKRLLAYLINEQVEGRSSQIKGFSIAVDVFNQGKDFDSDKSALVRNSAVRLRGLLNSYYLGEGRADPVRFDVPKGGYAPLIAANDSSAANRPEMGEETQCTRVAVLPFSYQSDSRDYYYLASGFSQELTDALTKFDDLTVIGVGHQLGADEQSDLLAEEVRNRHVDYLISGTIKILQNKGVVLVRLTSKSESRQIWSESYKIDLARNNLFDLQAEISGKIASRVGGEYGRINQSRLAAILGSRPQSLDEQQVLLMFYHTHAVVDEKAVIDYHRELNQALNRDPDSPLLNALSAGTYQAIWINEFPGFEDAFEKFSYHAEKAFALNPNHQMVISTIAGKCFHCDERERFFTLFDQYGTWTANSPLRLGSWAMWTCYFGEWELGMKLMSRVLKNNIDVPGWIHCVPCMYQYRQGNYEEALVEANKIHVRGLFWGPAYRTAVLGQLGRHTRAKREYEALLECRPDFPERGRTIMGRFFKEPGLLDHFIEGFEKIGIEIS